MYRAIKLSNIRGRSKWMMELRVGSYCSKKNNNISCINAVKKIHKILLKNYNKTVFLLKKVICF